MRQTQNVAPIYYVGRGGAGNKVRVDERSHQPISDTESICSKVSKTSNISIISSDSTASNTSTTRLFNHSLKKGWGWMVSHDDQADPRWFSYWHEIRLSAFDRFHSGFLGLVISEQSQIEEVDRPDFWKERFKSKNIMS
jgi:hypothetical protein